MPGEWRLQLLEGWFIFEMISAAGLNSPVDLHARGRPRNRTRGEEAAFFETPGRYPLASSLFFLFFSPLAFSPIGSNKACPLAMSNRTKTNIDRGKLYSTGKDPWTFSIKPSVPPSLSLSLSLLRLARVKITITVDTHARTQSYGRCPLYEPAGEQTNN